MYQIKCDDYILLDHRDPDLIVTDPKVKLEVNTIGEGSFTIYNKHPFYNKLLKLKSVFEVRDEVGVIFRGRMTDDSHDFYNAKAVDLEGAMGYFNDSMVRPFKYPDDFSDNAEYNSATNVVEYFLKWLIDNHNSQVKPFQQFKLGTVTVSDPNNYITRSSEKHDNTWNVLKSKLFDSELGGFLCIRYEEDGNYIDYLSEFTLTNTQEIMFGENLLNLKHDSDASETYSAIIPIGAEVEEETTDEETGETSTVKHTITIEDLADGNVNSDIVKQGDTIYSKSAVDSYGWIYAPIEKTTWTDVTLATNLLNKGVEYLSSDAQMLIDSVELTAADLHFTDSEIRSFRIYRNVKVKSALHNQDGVYQLTKLEIPLLKPQDTKITVGNTKLSLTSQNAKDNADAIERIEIVEKDIEENRTSVSEVQHQMLIQLTEVLNTSEEILLKALESYVETGSFEQYKETVSTELKVLSDQLNVKVSETIQQIENINGDLQEKYNTITKYFTFDIDGLTIGQVDNPKKIVIDNDDISIMVNNTVVQQFDAEGNALIPSLKVTTLLDMFGYTIDQDEEGNVNCEYTGG
jgi:hypothetical protein